MKQISTLTITEIQQALNQGELSAQEIALHTLDTISAANPAINAYTHITADRMLSEAYRLDTLRAKGQALPALAAIPYAVKICLMWRVKPRLPEPACFVNARQRDKIRRLFHASLNKGLCCPAC